MQRLDEWDVVVVGAGPAGSTVATLLSRLGYRVALVERAHFPREKACAEYMSPGVIETLRRLSLSRAIVSAERLQGMDIISPRSERFRIRYRRQETVLEACALARTKFDTLLAEQAVEAGAQIYEGCTVMAPLFLNRKVVGVTCLRGGEKVELLGHLVIGADGTRSVLRAKLGLSRSPPLKRLGLVAHYHGTGQLSPGFGEMHVDVRGYCGVAPLPNGDLNVAIVVRGDAIRRSRVTATAFFESWISRHSQLSQALEGCSRIDRIRGVAPIASRATKAHFPGLLLVGDAAGFFDPFTGEGIYRALRDAELAAFTANELLTGRADPSEVYADHEIGRSVAFRQKAAVTRIVQLFVRFPILMDYALPRLRERSDPGEKLGAVLGDIADAGDFLNAITLWQALRP